MSNSPSGVIMQQLCGRFMLQPIHRFGQQKKKAFCIYLFIYSFFLPARLISLFPALHTVHAQRAAHNGVAKKRGVRIWTTANAAECFKRSGFQAFGAMHALDYNGLRIQTITQWRAAFRSQNSATVRVSHHHVMKQLSLS